MVTSSLRGRLAVVWIMALLACSVVAELLVQLSRQSTDAQVGQAQAVIARSCDRIADEWKFYTSNWSGPQSGRFDDQLRAELRGVVSLALARQPGVEGGLWQTDTGSLAYAFPSYTGSNTKTDLPAAELARIEAVNRQALRDEQSVGRSFSTSSEVLLLHACPLSGSITGITAWTMTRVQARSGLDPLRIGLAALFALMVAMTAWLGRILIIWGRNVRAIRSALSVADANGIPALAKTGERELDEIVGALNDASHRLAEARSLADDAAQRAARSEHLAGLGRVAAGVAHEIRNPIAAALLQGENALAGDDDRRRVAIKDMLNELGRLDRLVTDLLAMTQRVKPQTCAVDVDALVADRLAANHAMIAAKDIRVSVNAEGSADLDPAVVGRIVDNLLTNAVRHTPAAGTIAITAARASTSFTLTVADSGPGVASALTQQLFEPFVTGRPDGTGLGLAIARELAMAHGGSLELQTAHNEAGGAVFTLLLPQPTDATEPHPADRVDRR